MLDDGYKKILLNEQKNSPDNSMMLAIDTENSRFLGYEILGWDCCGFHSYLCNGLEKDISEAYCLKVNDLGIIQNLYTEVKEFADYIDGKGEPVIWIPFAIYEYL